MSWGVRPTFTCLRCSIKHGMKARSWDHSYRRLSHKYFPLEDKGQIRLLKLLRGSLKSPIKCEFLPTKLSNSPPKYSAISYAWGDPALKHKIECENDELGVTETVHVLLEQLRDPEEDRIIWIDAVCIDQTDFEERSQQVRLMGRIYSLAECVHIWLGPENDNSALLEEFIPRLAEVFSRARRTQLFTDEVLFQKTGTRRSSPEWIALKALFARPWFNRTWVVQEIIASTRHDFLCGELRISADDLLLVARELRYLHLNGNAFVREHGFDFATISKFLRMARIWKSRKRGAEANLSYLTYGFWTSESSDPRDKIFSMLGLDNDMSLRMEPNYHDSVQEVYTKATRESLLIGKSTKILSLAGTGHHRILKDLPSWVPDFSNTETPSPPFGLHMYNGNDHAAWGSYDGQILLSKTFNQYRFEGTKFTLGADKFDRIKSLGMVLDVENKVILTHWSRETEQLFRTSSYSLDAHFDWEIHWRSIIADRIFKYSSYMNAPSTYGSYYDALRRQLQFTTTAPAKGTNEFRERYPLELKGNAGKQITPEMRASTFVTALWQSAHKRRYCVTNGGDVGLVPRYAAVGDVICLLIGCDIPFVIRSCEHKGKEDENVYELVGECFLYGTKLGDGDGARMYDRVTLM